MPGQDSHLQEEYVFVRTHHLSSLEDTPQVYRNQDDRKPGKKRAGHQARAPRVVRLDDQEGNGEHVHRQRTEWPGELRMLYMPETSRPAMAAMTTGRKAAAALSLNASRASGAKVPLAGDIARRA